MSRLLQFLEDRLGVVSAWQGSMSEKCPPRGIGWLRTLGFCALFVAIYQVLSGVALALHYVPSTDHAYDSILAIEADVPLGAFTRSLHHFGASAFVVLALLHMMRVFFTGAYKQPREFTWLTGVALLLVVLGFGFTGYLLPWDQKAYFATKVGVEIAGKAPIIGADVRQILAGGESVGPPTLTRFYVIHVVLLPLALFGLLGLHMFLIQRHGVSPPGAPVGARVEPGPPYFPHHVLKEAIAALLVTGALVYFAATQTAPLEALAEPSDTNYDPRPDWYFLGLFQLLKVFKGPLEPFGAFWLPNLALVALFALPFIDRNPARHWRRRPVATALGVVFLLAAVGLTATGAADPPEHRPTLRHELGLTDVERQGYLLVRRLKCLDCHPLQTETGVLGGSEDMDAPELDDLFSDADSVAAILEDPREMLSEDTEMPSFAHVPYQQRLAVALYLETLME
ncbi:MAG: cytochrome bc complex cytochrome b subunit [Planctomycetota bacterium]